MQAPLEVQEFSSDAKIRVFIETYRIWVKRYLLVATPLVLLSVYASQEPVPWPLWSVSLFVVTALMFGPVSAPLALSLCLVFYLFMLIGSGISTPGIATFSSLQPAIIPLYAVCFGGIGFGVVYWLVLCVVYGVFIALHAWNWLLPAAIPIFGVPFSAWLFTVLVHGLMYDGFPRFRFPI
jgi:hypothetical protein